jgi:DNA-binding transcriptional ArsR family regulator
MSTLQPDNDLEAIPVLPADVPVVMPELPIRLYITTTQQFKAVSDPTRSRILGIIQNQPATAKQIADRLGATPGAIGHHLHVLEAAGLAKVVARRLVRGIVANYYTRTARIFTYEFPREVTGGASGCLEILTHARDELVESLATIENDPFQTDGFPHIRLSPERAQVYSERLQALIEDVLHETPDPNGEVYGILVAMFKAPAYMQGPSTSIPSESSVSDEGSDS